jgi:hypothetical protein
VVPINNPVPKSNTIMARALRQEIAVWCGVSQNRHIRKEVQQHQGYHTKMQYYQRGVSQNKRNDVECLTFPRRKICNAYKVVISSKFSLGLDEAWFWMPLQR